MKAEKMSDGKYPRYADGGYPLYYVMADGECLCADCMNDPSNPIEDYTGKIGEDRQWALMGCDILWEGPSAFCAHCNAEIEPAYGDPDKEKENE